MSWSDESVGVRGRLLSPADVADWIGCSKRHVFRLVETGRIPPPLHIGPQIVRWSADVIERWLVDGCPAQQE